MLDTKDDYISSECRNAILEERYNHSYQVAFEAGYAKAVADRKAQDKLESQQLFNACTRKPEPTQGFSTVGMGDK